MLWRSSKLIGYHLRATDGAIGSVADLLFDDHKWTTRWAVVDTGHWLPGRRVLLPPTAFGRPDAGAGDFPVQLTRQQVKDCPGPERDEPVSRHLESQVFGYYGWTPYWYPGFVPLAGAPLAAPLPLSDPPREAPVEEARQPKGDPNLRSMNEVTGYHIGASDGEIGHVEEFLVADEDWAVKYLVVDTRNWWPGRKVLVAPQWLRSVVWNERLVHVDLTREAIRNSPEYDPDAGVDPAYEDRLRGHYGSARPGI